MSAETPTALWPPGARSNQSGTWEPRMTVRSVRSPKCSIALDALGAIPINGFLRQRWLPGVGSEVSCQLGWQRCSHAS